VRRPAPRRLGESLRGLTARLAPATTLARVQSVWEPCAGPAVAAAAAPTAEHGGVLTLTCSAAVWAQELDLMSADLIERLNGALGEPLIKAMRCRTG
jgi:predicted nucleic acid-binding Zn ribbon protein